MIGEIVLAVEDVLGIGATMGLLHQCNKLA
jgi:hypothetical protein